MTEASIRPIGVSINILVFLANQLKGNRCQPFNSDMKVYTECVDTNILLFHG